MADGSLIDLVETFRAANTARRVQLARDLAPASTEDLRALAERLRAHREVCCASESDCDSWWELMDLRWVLARRAESAGSIP